MALNGLGINVSPKEVGDVFWKYGDLNKNGVPGSSALAAKIAVEHFGATWIPIWNLDEYIQHLAAGNVVGAVVSGGMFTRPPVSHAVTSFALKGGQTNIYDPYSGHLTGLYRPENIFDMRSMEWVDAMLGYTFYAVVPWIFADVPWNYIHANNIRWAHLNNITKGSPENSDTYNPFAKVNRGQMASFLYRIIGSPKKGDLTAEYAKMKDVPKNYVHRDAIAYMYKVGITEGDSSATYNPYKPVSRAQMATFLWRVLGKPSIKLNSSDYALIKDVSKNDIHRDHIAWLRKSGITKGSPEGSNNYSPNVSVNRGQMASFLHRVVLKAKVQ
jgi:hypothetical protein